MQASYSNVINIFSIVLILINAYIIFSSKNFRTKVLQIIILTFIIEVLMLQGYFIHINSEMRYDRFMQFVLLITLLFYFQKPRFNYRYTKIDIVFGVYIISCIMLSIVFPKNITYISNWDLYLLGDLSQVNVLNIDFIFSQSIKNELVAYICFFLSYKFLRTQCHKYDVIYILKCANKIFFYNIYYVIFEFICKNVFHNSITYDIADFILGTGMSTFTELATRIDGIYALQGLTREPSHLSFCLFYTLVFKYMEYQITNHKVNVSFYFINLICFILMYTSGSFTTFLWIGLLLLLYLYFYQKEHSIISTMISLFLIILIGGFLINMITDNYINKKFLSVYETLISISNLSVPNDVEIDSSFIRFMSIVYVFIQVIDTNFITGIGLGLQSSSGGLILMLADLGLLGIIVWFKLLLSTDNYDKVIIFLLVICTNIVVGTRFYHSLYILIIFECCNLGYIKQFTKERQ